MSNAQDLIKAAISSLHSCHLKSQGFRKAGNTWIRTSTRSEVINIQLSQWNTANEATLTLNFGIYIPELHSALGGLPLKGTLKEYDCDIRSRIGRLHVDRKDYWWDISESTNPEDLADSLHSEISNFGLPWFGRLATYEDIAEEFSAEKNHFKAAIAYHLAGLPDEATTSMTQAYSASSEHAKARISRIARSLTISTNGYKSVEATPLRSVPHLER